MELKDKSNSEIASYLGSRIRSERTRLRLTQLQFATQAGIPIRTYKRLELSGKGSIENMIEVLRISERLRILEFMFSSPPATHKSVVDRVQGISDRRRFPRRNSSE